MRYLFEQSNISVNLSNALYLDNSEFGPNDASNLIIIFVVGYVLTVVKTVSSIGPVFSIGQSPF